jgi:hypothetical protein
MAVTGRTGADAIFLALSHICRIIVRFRVKLSDVIDAAKAAALITDPEAAIAHTFIDSAASICAIFEVIANYSGF